jgi:hypothetical protein
MTPMAQEAIDKERETMSTPRTRAVYGVDGTPNSSAKRKFRSPKVYDDLKSFPVSKLFGTDHQPRSRQMNPSKVCKILHLL